MFTLGGWRWRSGDGWTMKDEKKDSVQMGGALGRLPFLGLCTVAVPPLQGRRLS